MPVAAIPFESRAAQRRDVTSGHGTAMGDEFREEAQDKRSASSSAFLTGATKFEPANPLVFACYMGNSDLEFLSNPIAARMMQRRIRRSSSSAGSSLEASNSDGMLPTSFDAAKVSHIENIHSTEFASVPSQRRLAQDTRRQAQNSPGKTGECCANRRGAKNGSNPHPKVQPK